jgi:hypothetical protein
MSYPSGSGTISGPWGPATPNGATQGQAPPFGAPAPAANVSQTVPAPAIYNFNNSITSTQEDLNNTVWGVPQQGLPYNTNSSQVLLAGVAVSGFSYYTGITRG